ncbi:23S rRNA (pseudouridine(1915)-N(3))-methyltransferase RlmH [Pigmentiphaga soli]|uniref:Ribosomal RNA large subunit methyltransferase H n=1 Tax=Pigmentiphaga soli TaxID=1007095 RepID=A0ABP8GYH8_9BURK
MKLLIAAVGTRMPGWVDEAFADYAKRMPPDCAIELREIRPEARSTGKTAAQMQSLEARRIEAALPPASRRIALDERGRDLTTVELSRQLQQWRDDGRDVALLIGGPDGLEPGLKSKCEGLLRLSSLTLPHGMVRVLLAEQLYRAWSILNNHPYHRGAPSYALRAPPRGQR